MGNPEQMSFFDSEIKAEEDKKKREIQEAKDIINKRKQFAEDLDKTAPTPKKQNSEDKKSGGRGWYNEWEEKKDARQDRISEDE